MPVQNSAYDIDAALSQNFSGILQFGGARMAVLDVASGFWGIRRQLQALVGHSLTNSVFQQAGANGGASFAESFVRTQPIKGMEAFHACLAAYQSAGFGHFEITSLEWALGRIRIRATDTIEAWMIKQNNQATESCCCAYTSGVLVGFINVITERRDIVCVESGCQGKGDLYCQFDLLPADQAQDQQVVALAPDPGLGRQINLLELLFDRMPMGIAILDKDYCIRRYNPTWQGFSEKYAPPSAAQLYPGVSYFDLIPGTEPTVMPLFERVWQKETVQQTAVRLDSKGVVTYWDVVLAPLIEQEEVIGILNVAVDATERVEARQILEQRIGERTRELQILLDVAAAANQTSSLDDLLSRTQDLLLDLLGAKHALIILRNDINGVLENRGFCQRGSPDQEELAEVLRISETVITRGEPEYSTLGLDQHHETMSAWLPLNAHDRIFGALVIIGTQPRYLDIEQKFLLTSIANQVAVAIENKMLFEEVEKVATIRERSRLARDLHDAVTQTLFSANLVAEVLPIIWEKNPEEARSRLEELRQLTRGALSEMRTLLFELRPAAIVDTDLKVLTEHLVNAFIARTRLLVHYNFSGTGGLPPHVKEVFYRVAQEALNNIAQHAEASAVTINLHCDPEEARLVIQDDGCGFEPQIVASEHLGLRIMRERLESIEARLTIRSKHDQGTTIRAAWRLPRRIVQ